MYTADKSRARNRYGHCAMICVCIPLRQITMWIGMHL